MTAINPENAFPRMAAAIESGEFVKITSVLVSRGEEMLFGAISTVATSIV